MPAVASLSKSNSWPSSKPLQCPRWSTIGTTCREMGLEWKWSTVSAPATAFYFIYAPSAARNVSNSWASANQSKPSVFPMPPVQSNVKCPISPVQSNKIHSLSSSRKFAGLLKAARPIKSIVKSNAKRLVKIKRPVKSLSKPSSQISTKCPLKQFSLPIHSGSILSQSQTTKNQKLLIYFGHSMRLQVYSRFHHPAMLYLLSIAIPCR